MTLRGSNVRESGWVGNRVPNHHIQLSTVLFYYVGPSVLVTEEDRSSSRLFSSNSLRLFLKPIGANVTGGGKSRIPDAAKETLLGVKVPIWLALASFLLKGCESES